MSELETRRIFKSTDLIWFAAIVIIMLNSGVWALLSPRPEIGQVAVLWLPSAVLLVAILRNWDRPLFVALSVIVFYACGLAPAFENKSLLSSFVYLTLDCVEVGIIHAILLKLGGPNFRLSSALNVGIFLIAVVGATGVCGVIASVISRIPMGAAPIAIDAPLQVGVAWFTSNLATYLLASAPLIGLTSPDRQSLLASFRARPLKVSAAAFATAFLTLAGHILPQWLVAQTGLKLGSGGLVLIAFPLATYLAFRFGPTAAALCGAAIGIPTIYATMAGFGPFGTGGASENIFEMQATLIVCTFTLLLIGAMAEQLRERARVLERTLEQRMDMGS
jgi:hypothetical protein